MLWRRIGQDKKVETAMPTVMRAKMDGSDVVRLHHVSLTGTYLGIAQKHAKAAGLDEGDVTRDALIAITFAAMALECFANELAEDVVPEAELQDFLKLRKRFRAQEGRSSVVVKLGLLLAERAHVGAPPDLISVLEELFQVRNSLVHYKLSESAGKTLLPPARPTLGPDGSIVMWSISFIEEPKRRESPLISAVTPEAAIRFYNAAFDWIHHWMAAENRLEYFGGFEKLQASASVEAE